MFIHNAWYVVATSDEVGRAPLGRRILSTDVVLYRSAAGRAVMMADRCAHRAYPLSEGRLVGDNIQCGYHGFEYDCSGVCVRVPAQERVPQRAVVQTYPLTEKDGWIWAWMGDPELANGKPVPDTHWRDDPQWAAVKHVKVFRCGADLLHDNLLDLTHESFLHTSSIGDDSVYENGITVEVDANTVSVDRFMPKCHPSPLFARATRTELVDRWHTTEFQLPSLHTIHAGVVEVGGKREDGYLLEVLNAITPIDEDSSWYFYSFCRNFDIDDEATTQLLTESLAGVLQEDEDALYLQQLRMKERPADLPDVLIAQDAGVAKARRMMKQMLASEQKARTENAARTPAGVTQS